MSGTIIVIPVAWASVLLLKMAAGMAAKAFLTTAVKCTLDECISDAAKRSDEEKAHLVEWREFRESLMADDSAAVALETAVKASEQRLAAMSLGTAAARSATDLSSQEQLAAAQRQLGCHRLNRETVAEFLAEINTILQAAPASLSEAPGNPPAKLQEQYRWFQKRLDEGDAPDSDELAGLRDTVVDTLHGHLEYLQRRQVARQALMQRLEPILDILLFTRQAVLVARLDAPDLLSEMDTLRVQLLAMCQARELNEGAVAFLERRIKELQQQTDKLIVDKAQRRGVAVATVQHLTGMGYTLVEDFGEPDANRMTQARLRIPGGEQVRIAIHSNLQVAFEVVHERGPGKDAEAPVSVAEQARFMRQENRWCQDHRELMRRLVADGFPYKVSFERHVDETSIKVVVVESADELADSEEFMDDETTSRRTLD